MSLKFETHLCCVKKCLPPHEKENIKYHAFPKSLDRKNYWIQLMKPINLALNCRMFLCSRHFKENQYGKKNLKPTAEPFLSTMYSVTDEKNKNIFWKSFYDTKKGNRYNY